MAKSVWKLCPRLALVIAVMVITSSSRDALAAGPSDYEPGIDPGVGFNLVSWANFGANGPLVWETAVQSAFDAGFDEVSLSPVRFYTIGNGTIDESSSSGPELSHIAAGITRAKSLGMRVTVNPFIEPQGFSTWRGFYNPTPDSAEWNTFWDDYQQYVTDVAEVAETHGADSITVGTELRGLSRNSGNNAKWGSVINAADAAFSGTIGYAANWDNYDHPNVATAIWQNSAIDYLGIDSYFTGLLSNSQADASGEYPNASFIDQVESAWNNKLDNEILPYASALQSGSGLPVEFTEVGYLPYNRTTNRPQNGSGTLDEDEQNMAFEGLMRALDGRRATGEFLATHIWQWDMPGSGGSQWNFNPSGGNQPTNQQTAQWLSNFVKGTITDPPDPPSGATQVLYSFEEGIEGFFYPNFETEPASTLARVEGLGATDGEFSLAITKPTSPWTWDTRVQMTGEQLEAVQQALADNDEDYLLEIDVTYVASDLPANLSDINLHISLESNLDGWNQVFPFADLNSPQDASFTVEIPLGDFNLSAGISSAIMHLGFAGSWSGDAIVYIDRIALTDTTFVSPENPDFNGDGIVDAADYTVWRDALGSSLAAADANGDGTVDGLDYAVWRANFGAVISEGVQNQAAEVPEPGSVAMIGLLLLTMRVRRRIR